MALDVEVGIVQDECFSDSRKTVVFALEDIFVDGERIGKYDTATLAKTILLEGQGCYCKIRRIGFCAATNRLRTVLRRLPHNLCVSFLCSATASALSV